MPNRVARWIPLLLAAALAGCASAPTTNPSLEQALRARTPAGSVNADVTQANIDRTICMPGWTATVRPSTGYTNGVKAKLLREQGLPASEAARYELDHVIPLALGGHPRKLDNLMLQSWDGAWSARTKDRLEVKLKALVCRGQLSLERARHAIATDWIAAYKTYVTPTDALSVLTEPVQ